LKVRFYLTVTLSLVWAVALVFGMLTEHRGIMAAFASILLIDAFFWKWKFFRDRRVWHSLRKFSSRGVESQLLSLFRQNDLKADAILVQEIHERMRSNSSGKNTEELTHFLILVELRHLMTHSPRSSKEALQEAFFLRSGKDLDLPHILEPGFSVDNFSIEDIADSATSVAGLLWKTYRIAREERSRLNTQARRLLEQIFSKPFESGTYEQLVETMTDSIQREGGLPFLLLNLIQRGQWSWAKPLGQRLLTSDLSLDEESRACLYWMAETQWFIRKSITVPDFESTIRYLYHLCFVNPERAGFLEIDSQFFSQFETVNELAKEGFLFKETLVDRVLVLWGEQPQFFDGLFRESLQVLTQQKNKIYQNRDSWLKWWERVKEDFEKEYLFVVEGNLHYSAHQFKEALDNFDKALEINPHLRSALLNRLFCLAKLNRSESHLRSVEEIKGIKSLYPSSLSVIGNSFLILGKDDEAKKVYSELSKVDGWARKVDYYCSTFCFENGLFEKALFFALRAHEANPEDMSVGFHLSQCYNAVGKKAEALESLKNLGGNRPHWVNYYRFTLERDSGRLGEAQQTLAQIPIEYFDDPEELEAALDFAKNSSDLNLLRRLKARG